MLRRGIAFGQEIGFLEHLTGRTHRERGLIFKCYCTNIAEQFEFVQAAWSNNPDFAQPDSLVDPIIGQVAGGEARPWTDAGQKNRFDFQPWVLMKGGGYFFAPAIGVLKSLG
jgi:deferrochelatase/peroxidase EfeB